MEEDKYIVVTFPESHELMHERGFDKNSYFINDEDGIKDFGFSAYFVKEKWYKKIMEKRKI